MLFRKLQNYLAAWPPGSRRDRHIPRGRFLKDFYATEAALTFAMIAYNLMSLFADYLK